MLFLGYSFLLFSSGFFFWFRLCESGLKGTGIHGESQCLCLLRVGFVIRAFEGSRSASGYGGRANTTFFCRSESGCVARKRISVTYHGVVRVSNANSACSSFYKPSTSKTSAAHYLPPTAPPLPPPSTPPPPPPLPSPQHQQ